MRGTILFNISHHLLFEFQIFKHRLDHHVHLIKSAVIRAAG